MVGLRMTRGNGNGEGTRNIDVAKAGITVGFLDPNLHLGMCQWFHAVVAAAAAAARRRRSGEDSLLPVAARCCYVAIVQLTDLAVLVVASFLKDQKGGEAFS